MNTTRRLLIMAVVLALPLWIAGSAVGGDLDAFCAAHPEHSKCPDEPPSTSTVPDTTTTTTSVAVQDAPGLSCEDAAVFYGMDFDTMQWSPSAWGEVFNPDNTNPPGLTLTNKIVCIDLLTAAEAVLTVEVTDPGSAGQLMVNLRDSHPGDWCSITQFLDLKKAQPPLILTVPASNDESGFEAIPPATINACGTGISEATLDENDEIASQIFEATGEADPLALLISYGRSGPTTVKVQVTYKEP
jgi:hypothetical protein